MGKNKSLNTIENMMEPENNEHSISDELFHWLMHTVIDFQGENDGISVQDTFLAIHKLTFELLIQMVDNNAVDESREELLAKVNEIEELVNPELINKYGEKINWPAFEFYCARTLLNMTSKL